MSLILVTGVSTSGKSTIARELSKRGYEAYDTEHNGISAWYNKKTGIRTAEFGQIPERTKTWMDQHEWRISIDWVKEIAKQAHSKRIFLCGGGANESEVRAMCQKVFWLQTDAITIHKRVTIPRDHTYGTEPHELASAIEANKRKEKEYKAYGASIVNATQPIEEVIDEIINLSK